MDRVWIVLEQEPGDESFPTVVTGVYATKASAEEAIKKRTKHATELYPNKRIGWGLDLWFELDGIKGHEVQK